jgi:hypothetical protein
MQSGESGSVPGFAKASSFPLDKEHHISRPQTVKPWFAVSEALNEKAPGEFEVVEHRWRCEPAFSFQIKPEFLCQLLDGRALTCWLWDNDAFLDEYGEKPPQNRGITRPAVSMT